MPASLQRPRSARTVLLRMAADDERAQRIRELKNALKEADPTKTARWIADQLDVSERSVAEWAATGAIGYPNCVKLAELVFDVDPAWLWRGTAVKTPDLMAALPNGRAESEQLDRIESALAELTAKLDALQADQDDLRTTLARDALGRAAKRADEADPAPAADRPSEGRPAKAPKANRPEG